MLRAAIAALIKPEELEPLMYNNVDDASTVSIPLFHFFFAPASFSSKRTDAVGGERVEGAP